MSDKLKEVMTVNKFGLCPKCGQLMVMMESHYNLFSLLPTGKYPSKLLEHKKDITYACECGYRASMVMTADGVYPKDYYDLNSIEDEAIKKLGNPIGYKEED